MIGGHGERVLLKIVAQYADMWNMTNTDAADMRRLIGVIERHADTIRRDSDQIEKTLMLAMAYNPPKPRDGMLNMSSRQDRALVDQRRFTSHAVLHHPR
jgi:uncharacterized protein Yka (UPF0111/DUF47 family)